MREKNSPNAAMGRSRKVTNMGIWCLGVQLGHLAPGGDKYGGLNLQVGGRRQADNLSPSKSKLLGNLNCEEEEKVHIGM